MESENKSTVAGGGCLGGIVACVFSAALNHSFWWGLLHFCFGWFYVLYVLLCRSKEIIPALRHMFGI